jgi:eukaryotic-like serine/threonine-protein kinase
MPDNSRVRGLIVEMLDSGKTPEEVCRDHPELLSEVQQRWQQFCLIDAEVEALLPEPGTPPPANAILCVPHTACLPQVPGYEVEAVLGRGGMGVVYKARHLALKRTVALKMLGYSHAKQGDRARFEAEAEAVARLQHPNVVQIYEIGETNGLPFFALEFVEGGSLARRLAGKTLPPRDAARLVATLAEAMHLAHCRNLVHRDLKPGNVLLAGAADTPIGQCQPKVSDFGLVRQMDADSGQTQVGVVMGTPSYMAPEQAEGRSHSAGPAADTYALGAILYECLTGRPPFKGTTQLETLEQVRSREPAAPSSLNRQVPRDLETICLKCLRKEPERRYGSARELADDLGRFVRGEPVAARPEGPVARLARRVRQRPVQSAVVAGSALLLCVVVGGGLWVVSERSAKKRATEAADAATERAAEHDVEEMVRWLRQSSWREARAALELATGRLGDRRSAGLRRRMEQGQRDLELALRMEALSASADGALGNTYAAEWEALFRANGLGQVSESPEFVAARIKESDIRDALVRAVDEWAYRVGDRQRQQWLEEVARLADPDPSGWRVLTSDPNILKDEAALRRVLETAPRPFPSLPFLRAIKRQLLAEKRDPVPLLRRVQAAHPDDFWVNYELGSALVHTNPAEAVRYLQAAVSLRPNAVAANLNLGHVLLALGRPDDALAQYRRVEELAPTSFTNRVNIANLLTQLGRNDEAEAQLRRIVALDPRWVRALRSFLVQHGQADEALLEWKNTIAAAPTDGTVWDGYPELCLFVDRAEEYRSARQSLLSRFGQTTDPVVAARTSRACLLLPAEREELRQAVALAGRAAAAAADRRRFNFLIADFLFAQALADYRQGQFDRAIILLRGEASRVLGPAPRLVLAMALHRNGKGAEARKVLAEAVLSWDWRATQARDQDVWLYHVLRREAEGLILPNLPAFLAGEYQPRDNDERLALLAVCQFTNRTLALARLYADAFAADPRLAENPGTSHRYGAARAAALAGCARGADVAGLGEEERRRWRQQARRWLREDLTAWEQSLGGAAGRLRAAQLARWRADPDLAGLREPAELAKFPADERTDCFALWAEVGAQLGRCGP